MVRITDLKLMRGMRKEKEVIPTTKKKTITHNLKGWFRYNNLELIRFAISKLKSS